VYFVFQLHFYCNLYLKYNLGHISFAHSFRGIIFSAKRNRLSDKSSETLLLSEATAHFGTRRCRLSWLTFCNLILLHWFALSLFLWPNLCFCRSFLDRWKLKVICILNTFQKCISYFAFYGQSSWKKYLNNIYITFWVQRWHLVLLHTVYSHAWGCV